LRQERVKCELYGPRRADLDAVQDSLDLFQDFSGCNYCPKPMARDAVALGEGKEMDEMTSP